MPTSLTMQTANVGTLWSALFQRALPNVDGKTFTAVIMEFPTGKGVATSAWRGVCLGLRARRCYPHQAQ
jgi:hypothetical protein